MISKPLHVRMQYTENDVRVGYGRYYRSFANKKITVVLYLIASLLFLLFPLLDGDTQIFLNYLLLLGALGIFLFVVWPWILVQNISRAFALRGGIQWSSDFTFTEKGYKAVGVLASKAVNQRIDEERSWSTFEKLIDYRDTFYVQAKSTHTLVLFPKRFFKDVKEQKAFKNLVSKALSKESAHHTFQILERMRMACRFIVFLTATLEVWVLLYAKEKVDMWINTLLPCVQNPRYSIPCYEIYSLRVIESMAALCLIGTVLYFVSFWMEYRAKKQL